MMIHEIKLALVEALGRFDGLSGTDVFYEWPDGANLSRAEWVSVVGGDAEFEPEYLYAETDLGRYEITYQYQVVCGSGPSQATPMEGDAIAYSLAHQVALAVDANPNIAGTHVAKITGVERPSDEDVTIDQTIVVVTVEVTQL